MQFGVDVPECAGMVREGDAANIPDNAFWWLENVIFLGPNVASRPGQQRVNTSSLSLRIEGIFDAGDIGAAL